MNFVDVLIRQAHPGPDVPPYESFDQKMRDARRHKQENNVAFPVLVDDVEGTTHQMYGGLADPAYIIDAGGKVAFYNLWTHAPTLHRALQELTEQGGQGVVLGGKDTTPHMFASMVDGWKGIRRGAPQSVIELELAAPGMAAAGWLGYQMRSVLAPVALRAKPLPPAAKAGFAVAAGIGAGLAIGALLRSKRGSNASGNPKLLY